MQKKFKAAGMLVIAFVFFFSAHVFFFEKHTYLRSLLVSAALFFVGKGLSLGREYESEYLTEKKPPLYRFSIRRRSDPKVAYVFSAILFLLFVVEFIVMLINS